MKKKPLEDIGDTAHDLANDIKTDLAQLGADAARLAEEVLAPRARDLADYVTPKVRDLATNVADYVQPLARDLGERGVHLAAEARESLQPRIEHLAADVQPKIARLASDTRGKAQPYLEDARELLQPRIEDARERLQPLFEDAYARVEPLFEDAYARVEPLVDEGRDRLQHDVLPRLEDAYVSVNSLPQTKEAKKRLVAARAALAGQLSVPEPAPKRSLGKTLLQLLVAGGLIAGIVYAVKRFLAPEDSGWQPHEPSPAYRPSPAGTAANTGSADADSEADSDEEPNPDAPRRAVTEPDAPAESADPFVTSPYGEGSYLGSEPPAGYAIKGNERSMKYHVQGSGGYDRTIADVWFADEEAAQAAGFSKAQR